MTQDQMVAALQSPGSRQFIQPPSVAGNALQGAFGVPAQQLQHMAGDVLPFPMAPRYGAVGEPTIEAMKQAIIEKNPKTPLPKINNAFDQYYGGGAQVIPLQIQPR